MTDGSGPTFDEGVLAEYQVLQAEITTNSELTAHVFTITTTATAALIGYGIQSRSWLVFIAPFAVLLPSLWFITSQLQSTVRIASYIRTFIEPVLPGLAWETRLLRLRDRRPALESKYTLSLTGIYGALGFASLGLAWAFADYGRVSSIVALALLTMVCGGVTMWLSWHCRKCFRREAAGAQDEWWRELVSAEGDGKGA